MSDSLTYPFSARFFPTLPTASRVGSNNDDAYEFFRISPIIFNNSSIDTQVLIGSSKMIISFSKSIFAKYSIIPYTYN